MAAASSAATWMRLQRQLAAALAAVFILLLHGTAVVQGGRCANLVEPTCVCNNKTNFDGGGGSDCESVDTRANRKYCYVDGSACSDEVVSGRSDMKEFPHYSYTACANTACTSTVTSRQAGPRVSRRDNETGTPTAAPIAVVCTDSVSWTFVKSDGSRRKCDWVAESARYRCANKISTDGVLASDGCALACDFDDACATSTTATTTTSTITTTTTTTGLCNNNPDPAVYPAVCKVVATDVSECSNPYDSTVVPISHKCPVACVVVVVAVVVLVLILAVIFYFRKRQTGVTAAAATNDGGLWKEPTLAGTALKQRLQKRREGKALPYSNPMYQIGDASFDEVAYALGAAPIAATAAASTAAAAAAVEALADAGVADGVRTLHLNDDEYIDVRGSEVFDGFSDAEGGNDVELVAVEEEEV
eukprot:gene14095-30811_t